MYSLHSYARLPTVDYAQLLPLSFELPDISCLSVVDYHVRGRIYQPDRVRVKANIAERTTASPAREKNVEEEARRNHARVIEEMKSRFSNYRENCYPRPKNGCRCVENSKVVLYDRDELCRVKAG
ncbi:hypothetical protein TTRE_0000164601 [Trichuris trichiura]|uniref:Uncharacterized protein n=1 Tax=Trichuris trichiura TaxID=36087 RepID=A0A077YZ75_TRITR|nr:hypothetical protein TTRE_0000164601 [Trichuris trichiura]